MSPISDSGNMDAILTASPRQFALGIDAVGSVALPEGAFDSVLVAGMGGSWMAAQLVSDAGFATVPMVIHRSYGVGRGVRGRPLVIASSFSGNTEETLSAYDEAHAAGYALIVIAAGGALEQRCVRDHTTFIKIPADPPTMQPRCATGYTVGILIALLARLGLITPGAEEQIAALEPWLTSVMDQARGQGTTLAKTLGTATPMIYASDQYATVAHIWKIKVNENAKTPAFWNVFPELNHNEMIGWTHPHGTFHVLMLRDSGEHPRILKRIDTTQGILQERGIPVTLVSLEGRTHLEKMFSTLLIGDWLSYRMALDQNVDPTPVPMVEDLKKRLKI